jgi:hypothetical protein
VIAKDKGEGGGVTIERNYKRSDDWNLSESEWKIQTFNGIHRCMETKVETRILFLVPKSANYHIYRS